MTRRRAYTALGETGGTGGITTPPTVWPPGWPWPGPPWPPGYGDGTYLGLTYSATTYTISITVDQSVTLIVEDYDDYDTYTGTTFSVTITGGGYRALYLLVDEGESLGTITSLDLSSTSLKSVYLDRMLGITTLDVSGNDLTELDISLNLYLTDIDASDNALTEGEVDTVLGDVEAYGTSNGSLDLCTNNAPSATGEVDKTTLESRGWTVCTDTGAYLEVYPQYNAERGTAFNLIIQAFDADGNIDTAYTPSGNTALSITSTDGSDSLSVTTTDNTGWSNGSKTVSQTISGGGGDDTATITASGDRTGTSETFNIKDSLAGSPAEWRMTFLQDFTVTQAATGVESCDLTCAAVEYVFTGTYSGLIASTGPGYDENNVQVFPNTAYTASPCSGNTTAVIQLFSSSINVGVLIAQPATDLEALVRASASWSKSSWQTVRLTLSALSFSQPCVDPDSVIIIVEAIA